MTNPTLARRRVTAGLLLITAVLFVLGVRHERTNHVEAAAPAVTTTTGAAPTSAGESNGETNGETSAEVAAETGSEAGGERATETGIEGTERVLGLDLESTATITGAVLVSLALAAALVLARVPTTTVAALAAVVAALFAIVDVAEAAHQHGRGHDGLAALAAAVAVGHLAVAALCASLLRPVDRAPERPADAVTAGT